MVCGNFNSPLSLPDTLNSIGDHFLYNCINMTSIISTGFLHANTFSTSDYSFSGDLDSDPSYITGITISGFYQNDILDRFPDRNTWPYRHLI
jgi:hypothetical protein